MKIIKSKRYKVIEGERRDEYEETPDPYRINFTREEERAKKMEIGVLFSALKDVIEASQVSTNQGKYLDQVSVYRKELQNRGFSIEDQDKKLFLISSPHTTPKFDPFGTPPQDTPMGLEDDNSAPRMGF